MIKNFTIGSDIEFFLMNEKGQSVSGEGIIPGGKYDPFVIESHRTLSLDNVSAEITINPVTNKEDFISEINFMKQYLVDYLTPKNLMLDIFPARKFSTEELSTPHAQLLGCEADYNMRTLTQNQRPNVEGFNGRSAGGHLHIAWPEFDFEESISLIYHLDKNLALPMLFMEPDNFRRDLYGKSSCVREKHYTRTLQGIEYRTLSNWFANNEELMTFVWEGLMKSIDAVNNGEPIVDWDLLSNTIDSNDKVTAKVLLKEYQISI